MDVERMPGESRQAHAAFQDYCLMGPGRSLRRLLARYQGQAEAGQAPPTTRWATLSTWSVRHEWQLRTEAFDAAEARQALALWRERRQAEREREWTMAAALLEQAQRLLEYPEDYEWRGVDAARLVDIAVKVARLAAEMDGSDAGIGAAMPTPVRVIEVVRNAPRSAPQPRLPGAGGADQ